MEKKEEHRRRVLLIDDDQGLLQALKLLMEQSGYEVVAAANAREGLAQLEKFQAEVILTDLMMPEMSGFTLLEKLQNSQPLIPVIVVSAYDSRQEILRALQRGAYDFVTKPFDTQLLRATVSRALEHHSLLLAQKHQRQTEAVIALAGAVAHELNQPLTVILGNIFLLQEKLANMDEETAVWMEQIFKSAYRMSDIVKRLTKITWYKTQTYHGDAQIVDLDEASNS